MPKYALYAKQQGDGCDYTIGCAQILIPLVGTDPNALEDEIRTIVEDHAFGREDYRLEELRLVQIVRELEVEDYMVEDEVDEEKEERRRQYERLKREFE